MRYVKYFRIQLKRALKLAVGIFPTAMLLFASLALVAFCMFRFGILSSSKTKYQIGIVGDLEASYLGFGIYAVQTLDSSRLMVDFIPMTEEEAKKAYRKGEIVAYVTVPEEFLESIGYGRNDVPLRYVTTEGQKGVGAYLMDELAQVVSRLVTSSQCSIYSMQEVAYILGKTDEIDEWTDDLNLTLINYVLNRTNLVEMEELGLSKGLLVRSYYFCTILLLFCFLFGVSSAGFFLHRNDDLGKWMMMRGIGPVPQVLCEYVTYFALTFLCMCVPLSILTVATKNLSFLNMKVWLDELLWAMVPITLLASTMHFMIYEVVKNPVANILLQFIGVLGMGYISGYIYPASFFPAGVARVGKILPTGVALDYLSAALPGGNNATAFWCAILYSACFLTISIVARRWMIMRENK